MRLETQLLIILSMNLQSKVIYCIRHFHINCVFFLAEDVLQALLACGAEAKIVFGTFYNASVPRKQKSGYIF
jgi:hypothetical protein